MTEPQYTRYKDALTSVMTELGKKDNTIFIGQQILFAGNPMSTTLGNVPKTKMIELPVMEESQMGMSLGMAMAGKFVITFYPRWDFIICATNQMVNHLDKIKLMSGGEWNPNMIIRLGPNISFHNLDQWDKISETYLNCYEKGGINVIVEYPELYYT